jgi:hypothetical protein
MRPVAMYCLEPTRVHICNAAYCTCYAQLTPDCSDLPTYLFSTGREPSIAGPLKFPGRSMLSARNKFGQIGLMYSVGDASFASAYGFICLRQFAVEPPLKMVLRGPLSVH